MIDFNSVYTRPSTLQKETEHVQIIMVKLTLICFSTLNFPVQVSETQPFKQVFKLTDRK